MADSLPTRIFADGPARTTRVSHMASDQPEVVRVSGGIDASPDLASIVQGLVHPAPHLGEVAHALDNACQSGLGVSALLPAPTPASSEVERARGTEPTPKVYRRLPTELLYDEHGAGVFEQITHLEEYYLTRCETDLLRVRSAELAPYIPDNATIVELGAGSMTKTALFLEALQDHGKKGIQFYALDMVEKALSGHVKDLQHRLDARHASKVSVRGILSTYQQALGTLAGLPSPKVILWLGSSLGNLTRSNAAAFLQSVHTTCLQAGDLVLLGVDGRNDPALIRKAYNDSQGLTAKFALNTLQHANHLLKQSVFDTHQFAYASYYNEPEGRHEAYCRSLRNQRLVIRRQNGSPLGVDLVEDELVLVEYSYKYSDADIRRLTELARLYSVAKWTDPRGLFSLHLMAKPAFFFPKSVAPHLDPKVPAVPTIDEWQTLWTATDAIFRDMVTDYMEKPIALRHPFLFYLGHIPTYVRFHGPM